MTNHDFNKLGLVDGTEMDAYTAFPDGPGPFPAVIVFQEAFGVNQHMRDITERLRAAGYAAVAPELFHRTARHFDAPYSDFPAVLPHTQALTREGLIADAKATYDWLQQQDNVAKDKIGSIGFCLGGRASFLANTALPLSAAVSYYGGGLDTVADEAPHSQGALLFYWGGLDKHISPDKINTIIEAVKAAEKDYTNVVVSTADHGFNRDGSAAHHPLAAKETWAYTLAFLANRLK